MLNFSSIEKRGVLGRFLRAPLRLVPLNREFPILQGRLRGKKWVTGSGGNHGYWLGSYELEMQKSFCKTVGRGSVVYDIGANVGFFSLLASELSGPDGKVFSFEPLPENMACLKRHADINHCGNIVPVEAAVSDRDGQDLLGTEINSAESGLSPAGTVKVKTVTLDNFCFQQKNDIPTHIKIDVEGNELAVFHGARKLFSDFSPVVFLETHGRSLHEQCCHFLKEMGYKISPLDKKKPVKEAHAVMARKEK